MAAPSYARSLVNATKRLKLSPTPATQCLRQPIAPTIQQRRHASTEASPSTKPEDEQALQRIRLPRAVQATYLDPLRHHPTGAKPTKVAELQLRSYSVRNLEACTDLCLRAAYYLKLPIKGPLFLPKITERWTVPRSNFVHKKSQENFERITYRREIKVYEGHAETVAAWLGYLQKRRYYGVGLKANVFEYSGVEVVGDMDKLAEEIGEKVGEELELVGRKVKGPVKKEGAGKAQKADSAKKQ